MAQLKQSLKTMFRSKPKDVAVPEVAHSFSVMHADNNSDKASTIYEEAVSAPIMHHRGATTAETISKHPYFLASAAASGGNGVDVGCETDSSEQTIADERPTALPPSDSQFYHYAGAAAKYQRWDNINLYKAAASQQQRQRGASFASSNYTSADPVYFMQQGPLEHGTSDHLRRASSSYGLMSERTMSLRTAATVSTMRRPASSAAASFTSDFKRHLPPVKPARDYIPAGFRDPHRYDDLATPHQVVAAREAYDPIKMYLPALPEPCPICVPPIALPACGPGAPAGADATPEEKAHLLQYQRAYNNFDPRDAFCQQFPGGLAGLKRRNKYATVSWCTLLNLPRDSASCRDIWSHPRDDVLEVLIQAAPMHHAGASGGPVARVAVATAAAMANAGVGAGGPGLDFECHRGHSAQAMRAAAASRRRHSNTNTVAVDAAAMFPAKPTRKYARAGAPVHYLDSRGRLVSSRSGGPLKRPSTDSSFVSGSTSSSSLSSSGCTYSSRSGSGYSRTGSSGASTLNSWARSGSSGSLSACSDSQCSRC